MAHFITVLEPGKKTRALYAGKGNVTRNLVRAVQYTQPVDKLEEWCAELNRDNPGYDFAVKKIPANRDMYRNEPEAAK